MYERMMTKALITRTVKDAIEVGAIALAIDRLQEIRDSQDLDAPARWEDLKPAMPSDAAMKRGIADISKEQDRLAVREALRRQKIEDDLKRLGLKFKFKPKG